MKLSTLSSYEMIAIQCHDNPDADTIASGYALYCYFSSKGSQVRLFYSGENRIRKTNLKIMISKLNIPIEYYPPAQTQHFDGLLITVDCQYGSGNVTRFDADKIAMIDHHQLENKDFNQKMCHIQTNLGSCSTLVWSMLRDANYQVNTDIGMGTALYYGLYTDTNQFSELFNPLDMDMRESIPYNKKLITELRSSNLTLKELEIAGIAMLRYAYNSEYHFAVIKAEPCDPNILGIISDFLIQVNEINTCVVYNETDDGYKFSVRSCTNEVKANELADFLSENIGSGGGRYEKAGGFISKRLYHENYSDKHTEEYFDSRMREYFNSYQIIFARDYHVDISTMLLYQRKQHFLGYIKVTDIGRVGSGITVRTQQGDWNMMIEKELYFLLEPQGEIALYRAKEFEEYFIPTGRKVEIEEYFDQTAYIPNIKGWENGSMIPIAEDINLCIPDSKMQVYAQKLETGIKVFAESDDETYILGQPGDYLMVHKYDNHILYIMKDKMFHEKYMKIDDV